MHNIVSQGTKSKLYVQYYLTKDEDFEKVKFDARSWRGNRFLRKFFIEGGNPSIIILTRNHIVTYCVCMIWYSDKAKLWQLSVE